MNRHYYIAVLALVALWFTGCGPRGFDVDTELLQEKIYNPTAAKHEILGQSTVLYLDHSTCVIQARQNSRVFNAMRPQLGQYSDTLVLIKGTNLEAIALDRSENRVFQILQTIQHDISYAHQLKAIDRITNGNQQAILITDCEFIEQGRGNNGKDLWHDQNPFLSEPFKRWLRKGYSIYIVVEPYQERYQGKVHDKKLFYFIFTDDRLAAPISNNMLAQIEPLRSSGLFTAFKLTNADIFVQRNGETVDRDLSFTFESLNGFDFVAIDDKWKSIREYVMKLDKYGEPIPEESPVPLIKNYVFNEGNNYIIRDVEVVATNITSQYMALEDSDILSNNFDMSEGFAIDKDALRNRELRVYLTDKIFNYLNDDYGGNLIRLDFVTTAADLKPYLADLFTWPSLFVNGEAICVSQSIDNALRDIDVVPMAKSRRIIHTVFIKTESYKP